ncbi:Cupin domain protein [Granulicatella balaenopterae]|uniref:Cupin domain protein n=1 Tax=Granulicatella balaenopterae TaxID=137733 RepID=A0A1H9J2P9_9LACT|nr:cupin domain-containing protein [Granulicatella balaenopterae]SEQ81052.1 Cupin domain protein [Granulicatella balaenopterae]
MKLAKGCTFLLQDTIPSKAHQTISKGIYVGKDSELSLYSLATDTDISIEFYQGASVFIVLDGLVEIDSCELKQQDCLVMARETNRGVIAKENSIYIELYLKEEILMENITKGAVFQLKDCIDYVEGGISNVDIVKSPSTKVVLMAFDKGEGLTPHSAPADALIFALEGEAVMTIGEEEHILKAGEQIVFPKDIKHNVTARDSQFKMALILAK